MRLVFTPSQLALIVAGSNIRIFICCANSIIFQVLGFEEGEEEGDVEVVVVVGEEEEEEDKLQFVVWDLDLCIITSTRKVRAVPSILSFALSQS